jgi:hypothetical protein
MWGVETKRKEETRMLRPNHTFAVAVVTLVVYLGALIGEGYAEDLAIKLIVNPSKTDIPLGSEPIALTARVTGKNLTYKWELLGPGKLEGKGSSVFYVLPEKIEGESAQALITVTVTDESGKATTESVTFNILAAKAKTTGKSMSKGTKIAFVAGAIALLGGGIAVAAGGKGGDGGNNSTFNIVGNWTYAQSTLGIEGEVSGQVVFDGTAASGTFTIIVDQTAESYQGNYTVNGSNVSMTGSNRTWTGVYTSEAQGFISGVWNMNDNSGAGGGWRSWKR